MARCAGCGGFVRQGYDCNNCGIPGPCGPHGSIHGDEDDDWDYSECSGYDYKGDYDEEGGESEWLDEEDEDE